MSLKRKNELAMLAFLKASGLFDAEPDENGNPQYTVQFLTSQENQETNLSPPAVVAVWQRLKEFTDSKGRGTGRIIGRMDILIYGKADKQKGAATNPEDDHGDTVGDVESCFQISDLADQLSSR
jgi:hypothetical protein